MRHVFFAGAVAALAVWPAHATSPSFNCNSATTQSQIAICGDPVLAGQDLEREKLFSEVLADAAASDRHRLFRDYEVWHTFRDLCGSDGACLARRQKARIDELKAAKSPYVIIGEPLRPAPVTGVITEIARTTVVAPNLRVLGTELERQRPGSSPRILSPVENLAVITALGSDPSARPDPAITVDRDGTIRKRLADGSVAFLNPATGDTGVILPNGQIQVPFAIQVQAADLPPLPQDYDAWSQSVQLSLSGLVGNLLTPGEVQTLQDNAPGDFFLNLAFQLKILAFVTS